MRASEILSKAADLIEPEGKWCQGSYSNGFGGLCALGAIGEVEGCIVAGRDFDKSVRFLLDVIDHEKRSVAIWNDAPERTQAEVVSAIRKAAHLAKEQEPSDAL
jgi:hypothetical protein